MRIIKSFFIAFSTYSRIPMPQLSYQEEDMKYMLCFFPWIGAVIGGCLYFWDWVCHSFSVGRACWVLIGAAIPIWITGGFHIDGFMDTMDAFHSYQPRERKLEILKDSHVGAFAVIKLAAYGLLYLGALSEIRDGRLLKIVCAGFVLSRCLSGIGVVSFPSAKKDGLLHLFASRAEKRIVRAALYLQGLLCAGYMLYQSLPAGALTVAAALVSFGYYWFRCKRELGGITGDTAGYFLLLCEESMLVMTAVCTIAGWGIGG